MKRGVDYTAAMYRPQIKLQEAQRYLRLPSLRLNVRAKDRDRLATAEKKKREEKKKEKREKSRAKKSMWIPRRSRRCAVIRAGIVPLAGSANNQHRYALP